MSDANIITENLPQMTPDWRFRPLAVKLSWGIAKLATAFFTPLAAKKLGYTLPEGTAEWIQIGVFSGFIALHDYVKLKNPGLKWL